MTGDVSHSRPIDVLGVGAATWDRFLVVPHYPAPDEKVRATHSAESGGGTMATALVALARWGCRCRWVGVLGFDAVSDRILADLNAEGIDTSRAIRDTEADGRRSLILVDTSVGSRTIISGPHRIPPLDPQQIVVHLHDAARLHLDTSDIPCALFLARHARGLDVSTLLDAEVAGPNVDELLTIVDEVIASARFAHAVTGEQDIERAARSLFELTRRPVAVTDGANGCFAVTPETFRHEPALAVPVVDTTGAGDVFHAGYLWGWRAGWPVEYRLRFASWAAARTCQFLGGRQGIPSRDDVREFVEKG